MPRGALHGAMLVTDGSSSCSSSSRFGATSMFKLVTPVTLPPGRVGPYPEHDGNLAGRRLGHHCRSGAARSYQHGHSIANQPCRKLRQPTGVRLRPPIFDLDVLALYIARRT